MFLLLCKHLAKYQGLDTDPLSVEIDPAHVEHAPLRIVVVPGNPLDQGPVKTVLGDAVGELAQRVVDVSNAEDEEVLDAGRELELAVVDVKDEKVGPDGQG
jgi:hypothetical protein